MPRRIGIGQFFLLLSYAASVVGPMVHTGAHRSKAPCACPDHPSGGDHDIFWVTGRDGPDGDPRDHRGAHCADSCVLCQLFRTWSTSLPETTAFWASVVQDDAVMVLLGEPPNGTEALPISNRGPPIPPIA